MPKPPYPLKKKLPLPIEYKAEYEIFGKEKSIAFAGNRNTIHMSSLWSVIIVLNEISDKVFLVHSMKE
jgi:hypothetical protein